MNKRVSVSLLLLVVFSAGFYGAIKIKQVSSAYVFGYPLVLMDLTRKAQLGEAGSIGAYKTNHFTHIQVFPDHSFRNVVRPNNDTLYSVAWLDLAPEPMILSVPDMQGRYYVMPLMDAWTNVDVSIGKRLSGTAAGDFLISGPNWQGAVPAGLKHIVANTNMNWIIGRIQTNGKTDIPVVNRFQEQFFLTPLSRWNERKPNPNLFFKRDDISQTVNPSQQLEEMSGADFFKYLAGLVEQQRAAPEDAEMIETLGKLQLDSQTVFGDIERGLIDFAVKLTRAKVRQAITNRRANENGWRVIRDTIGEYGTNYNLRAAVAMVGLGAIPPAEASFPNTSLDSQGQALNGQHSYKLHFAPNQTPPVNAFWSLSMYDKHGFFIKNPINRYVLGDRDSMTYNPDGSLDIIIQRVEPENQQSNWLPAPKGEFELTMRVYHPKNEFIDGRWQLPAVERLNSQP